MNAQIHKIAGRLLEKLKYINVWFSAVDGCFSCFSHELILLIDTAQKGKEMYAMYSCVKSFKKKTLDLHLCPQLKWKDSTI